MPHQVVDLLARLGIAQRHKEVRGAQVSVVFWDLVFEDEVIAKSVPRQLAHQTVVLVKIVSGMREDYIRREDFLEFFEAFFDRRTEVGKESISKGFHHDSLLARLPEERPGTALRFRGACRIGTEDEPVELNILRLLEHPQYRATAANLNVVAVGPQAKHSLHSSQIARNHFLISY